MPSKRLGWSSANRREIASCSAASTLSTKRSAALSAGCMSLSRATDTSTSGGSSDTDATELAGKPIGMTASSVASVSLDPPLVLVSVARDNDMHPALKAADRFVLNVLAAEQEAISRRFAEDHPNRFDGIGYRETLRGMPVLEGALASI